MHGNQLSSSPHYREEMKKILWVDEDLTYGLRPFIVEFEDHLFSVLTAYDATEGKEIFTEVKNDIVAVILDIMMPHGSEFSSIETKGGFASGLALARYIRRENPELPIIAFSITRDQETLEWFSKNDLLFLQKQYTLPSELVSTLEGILSGKKKRHLNIFIVHGHDDKTKLELKNYIQNRLKLGEPIILHEQPSLGRTIIEKFEEETKNIDLAFVLLTPDDTGAIVSDPNSIKRRARQNVIFEMGYFYGKLQRQQGKVVLLYKGNLELPSDISGVIYIDISNGIEAAGEEIRQELSTYID